MIPDTQVEDSFDIQGCFVGRLPFDLEGLGKYSMEINRLVSSCEILASMVPKKVSVEPPVARLQPLMPPRRPPSDSALRSHAATTTANTFLVRNRPIPSTNLFTSATTATAIPSPGFAFAGFNTTKTLSPPTKYLFFLHQSMFICFLSQ